MNDKSKALRLADAIEKAIRPEASLPLVEWARAAAAAELRRLSAVEAERDALQIERDLNVRQCDPYAATRRAIVRAAAEIGKNMK